MIEKISDLNKHLVNARSKNLQIGTINGTFDLLHKGHIDAITYANNNCEKLFILVNSDYSVSLYKGPSRPKENENQCANPEEPYEILISPTLHGSRSNQGTHRV